MLLLFQEGIPDIFFPALLSRGCTIARFATEPVQAHKDLAAHPGAKAVFFRANFVLGKAELDLLPELSLAALVSTGSDNVDSAAVEARGLKFVSGEGANAQAVFDYVIQALLYGGFDPDRHSVGVIGVGHVGSRVLAFLKNNGVKTAHFDPFAIDTGSCDAAVACDFVTFHVPLTHEGEHKTAAMLSEDYFAVAQAKTHIIQASRGGIWEKEFYASLTDNPNIEILAQDVYPVEPPPVSALRRAKFSTPHIAGYSTRGRLGGILKGTRALFPDFSGADLMPQGKAWYLSEESAAFAAKPGAFSALRDGYGWRKEFHEYDAAEQAAFRRLFPRVPDAFFAKLFDKTNLLPS